RGRSLLVHRGSRAPCAWPRGTTTDFLFRSLQADPRARSHHAGGCRGWLVTGALPLPLIRCAVGRTPQAHGGIDRRGQRHRSRLANKLAGLAGARWWRLPLTDPTRGALAGAPKQTERRPQGPAFSLGDRSVLQVATQAF